MPHNPLPSATDATCAGERGRSLARRNPCRPAHRPNRRFGAGLGASQRRHPAGRRRRRFRRILPAQCPGLSAVGPDRPRRSAASQHARRPICASTFRVTASSAMEWPIATEPTDIRALVARRPGRVSHRLLVHLRTCPGGRRAAGTASGSRHQRADVSHERWRASRPADLPVRWSSACGPIGRRRSTG